MKVLANLVYGLKKSFWFIAVVAAVVLLEEFFVYLLYLLAIDAHIPFTNFDLFMKSIYYIFAMSLLLMSLVLIVLFQEFKPTKVSLFILVNSIVAMVAAYSGGMYLTKFETLFFLTFKIVIVSFICAILCSVVFRVIMNKLFRQLFTQVFQERCELYPDEDNAFYRINSLKIVIRFLYSNFRKTKNTNFSPLDWEQPYKELSVETGEYSPFASKPKMIMDEPLGVTVQFKYVPQGFTFFAQSKLWLKESIEEPIEAKTH